MQPMSDAPERSVTIELGASIGHGHGFDRRGEPVTLGVPLPRGAVSETPALRLADDAGRLVPLQAQALDRWPDGSVRWGLLDFRADVPARRATRYRLLLHDRGVPSPPPHSVTMSLSDAILGGQKVCVNSTATLVRTPTAPTARAAATDPPRPRRSARAAPAARNPNGTKSRTFETKSEREARPSGT